MVLAIAVAAVAVLAAVVALAMGKGGELAETHPDHPPLPLPDDRPLVGMDAAVLRLPRGLWGYHVDVTDEALRRLAYALTERETRVAVLERQLAELRERGHEPVADSPAQEPPVTPLADPEFAEGSAPWQPPYTPAAAQRFADLQPYANPEPYSGRPYAGSGETEFPPLQPPAEPEDVPQAYTETREDPLPSAGAEPQEQDREWPHGEAPVQMDLEAGRAGPRADGADDEWESLGTGQKPAKAGTGRFGQWAAAGKGGEAAVTPESVEYGWRDEPAEPADDAPAKPDEDTR